MRQYMKLGAVGNAGRFQQGIATDKRAAIVMDKSILIPCWVAQQA